VGVDRADLHRSALRRQPLLERSLVLACARAAPQRAFGGGRLADAAFGQVSLERAGRLERGVHGALEPVRLRPERGQPHEIAVTLALE
jgi:hypothetical protein